MPSISVPSEARLFDGASARARRVCVEREGDALLIDGDALPVALLRRVESRGRTTLHRTDQLDWRLVLAADDAIDLAGIPALHAVTATHWGWIGGAAAAVVFVAGTLWFAGPQLLVAAAPLVPHQVARGLGEPMAEMMAGEDKACRNPAGQRALTKLVARMQPREGFVEPVRVRVSRSGQINAFTLPGGDVILMSGLIAAAESPDEVAGVLAHEFGHVQQRHPNQALIRHFGLGVFIEGLGGNLGGIASTGLFLRHGRGAEREADEEAARILRDARVSPLGLSRFFARIEGEAEDSRLGRLASMLDTHPGEASRRARFAEAARGVRTTPSLNAAEWKALEAICG